MLKKAENSNQNSIKLVPIRIPENLLELLKREAQSCGMSLNKYINLNLSNLKQNKKILFEETRSRYEEKRKQISIYLSKSEIDLLKEYASVNEWSLSKEICYRIVSSLAKKPKLNREELKAIYTVRSAINVLGANINRLIRDSKPLTADNNGILQNLVELINELKNKISYLEKCNYSSFKLKEESKTR